MLPENIDYYYNGEKLRLNQIRGLIEKNSTMIFGKIDGRDFFEYAVLLDPIYSEPYIITNTKNIENLFADFGLTQDVLIYRNYEISTIEDIAPNDVLYIVSDYMGVDAFVIVIEESKEGSLTQIIPNKISPQKIMIDNQEYEISENFQVDRLDDAVSKLEIGADVFIILDKNNKILNIDRLYSRTGVETDIIVIANSLTYPNLNFNQIVTNKGVYNLNTRSANFEVGMKYNARIDVDTIVSSQKVKADTVYFVVERASGNLITQRRVNSNGVEIYEEKLLPYGITYYYRDGILSYSNVVEKLETNSSIVFVLNSRGTVYEYAVIIDPIYSIPAILDRSPHWGYAIGDVLFDIGSRIVKNGSKSTITALNFEDVVYEVYDYKRTSKYILAINEKVIGTLQEIRPNALYPREVKINGQWIGFSKYANLEKFTSNSNPIKTGDIVRAIVGLDGKIVEVR